MAGHRRNNIRTKVTLHNTKDIEDRFVEPLKPPKQTGLWRLLDPYDLEAHLGVSAIVLVMDFILSLIIVHKVPYTEIDWKTYMQQVQLFQNGEHNYSAIKGDTGPIVYPAGHVRIFNIFYHFTNGGEDVYFGQLIFVALYLMNQAAVFYVYAQSQRMPPIVNLLVTCISYRVHSIYMLRLFNDGIAMLFCYLAIACLVTADAYAAPYRSHIASCLFSFGVSIKMNILLFGPVFYLVMWFSFGTLVTFVACIAAGVVQLQLALPFLLYYPYDYLTKAFNFKRQFLYEWTVNWRFISESLFSNRTFHIFLLTLHCGLLTYFVFQILLKRLERQNVGRSIFFGNISLEFSKHEIIIGLFISNFIGIACSRSLHYQFYCWYFHTIPYILFSLRLEIENEKWRYAVGIVLRIASLLAIEYCWNVFPSTPFSSLLLTIMHGIILGFSFTAIAQEAKKVHIQ